MAYELIFKSNRQESQVGELDVVVTNQNEIRITITASDNIFDYKCIYLEKESAIKLAKELRKQISFLEG